ncbi:MAG: hypothetical protein EWV76_02210 [Microcystis novacekii Mn_MB_F_20050700_S1]|uniref:Uncharacterized protein n=1 Tax=Microcystis novacekii Mn_MB_F_20050700_S1D TaxID=2486266 RepID=A0A552J4G1_9CHRO|nr:MAG: hypothetical protein EWV54_06635 [Microcystis novacekii Mn_MB_F_20050700_S1D]TRU92413.1 MAG: hypothetical protein EWV76_02210 [Microcystis novacekii Mn_MB_F_20050700_S1]
MQAEFIFILLLVILPSNYILYGNFPHNTLQSKNMGQLSAYYLRRGRQNFPLYHAQKPVSQISLLQTASFKETDHRSLLGI